MTQITVIDALMGQGKTTYVFNDMKAHPERRYHYIGVSLTEAERCKAACRELQLKDPVPVHGKKFYSLKQLVEDGESVASTHQLFRFMDTELYDLLKPRDYHLVIDEAMEVVQPYKDAPDDMQDLFDSGKLLVDAGKCIRWNEAQWPWAAYLRNNPDTAYRELKGLCDNGNLVSTRDGILLWRFPAQFLSAYKSVIICTYMFEGQVMADYFKANGVRYEHKTLSGGALVDYASVDNTPLKEKLAALVHIEMDAYRNAIGAKVGRTNPLSDGWFKTQVRHGADVLKRLKNSTAAFFKDHGKGARENMWTTFKEHRNKVKGPRYFKNKCFVPMNEKATNQWKDKTALAYLVDRYQTPIVTGYFQDMGIATRDDLFALTELIQWVWRSAIRDGNRIQLFIPSERMRTILVNWIKYSDAEIVAGKRLDAVQA